MSALSRPAGAWWAIATIGIASRVYAQDVSVTPLGWVTREPPEQLPALHGTLRPEFPSDLRNTPDFGYVVLEIYVDEKGKSLGGRREATLPAYHHAVETELGRGLKFEPGRRSGQPVNTR